uniref:Uncharacterized protein n=2 Tax=Parascaris univalens TaxID=6257 RepID=A0A915BUT2_PARUN
ERLVGFNRAPSKLFGFVLLNYSDQWSHWEADGGASRIGQQRIDLSVSDGQETSLNLSLCYFTTSAKRKW